MTRKDSSEIAIKMTWGYLADKLRFCIHTDTPQEYVINGAGKYVSNLDALSFVLEHNQEETIEQ
jgi:hypothetical protein